MRQRAGILALAVLCSAAPAAGQQALEEVIGPFPAALPIDVGLPLNAFEISHALDRVASSVRMLAGFEAMPGESWRPVPPRSKKTLTGMTVRQALDFIAASDPRYGWQQDANVVHVGPVAAPASALTRNVNGFAIDSETAFGAVLRLCAALRGDDNLGFVRSGATPSELGQRRFSMPAMSGTLRDVLDQIAMRHGALSWHVGPPAEGAGPLRIGFTVFDGWGPSSPECVRGQRP